jgi:RHS repeat-associated protein
MSTSFGWKRLSGTLVPLHLRLMAKGLTNHARGRAGRASLAALIGTGLFVLGSSRWQPANSGSDGARVGGGRAIVGSTAVAPGDTITVWGPRQFNGSSGQGQTYVERFTATVAPGRVYTLHLTNGNASGGQRSSKVVITLNGFEIVHQNEVTQAVAQLDRFVAITDVDTIRVTVAGSGSPFITLSVLSIPSPEFNAYGPNQYAIPGGSSKTFDETFGKGATAAPPFRLYVVNGANDGTRRVTSGSVTLNGTAVVSTSELTSAVGSLLKDVTLLSSNTIGVVVNGPVNSYVTLRFTASDTTRPVLTITSPLPGAVTNLTTITVSGTLQDQTPTAVTVNGTTATVTNNTSYSAAVPLATEGSNLLTVTAIDGTGRRTDSTRTVIRDTQTPALSVTAPADGAVTQNATVTVSGTVTDATAVSANVNGIPLTVTGGSFTGSVSLAIGANVLTTSAADAAGNTATDVRTVTRDTMPPMLTISSPADGATTSAASITVSGSVSDITTVTVTVNGTAFPVTNGTFSGSVPLNDGENSIAIVAVDAAGNTTTVTRAVTRALAIPPDPATVATPIDPTIATTLASSTAFLYTGTDPIQTGVASGTIVATRAAVLRGRATDRAGVPLDRVRITALGHPEFGQTLTRADGRFDIVVNGGTTITLSYSKSGYLPAQRQIIAPWQEYASLDDVILTPVDAQVATVDFSAPIQVARGSSVTDASGSRRATVLFKQGTQASMVLQDGTTQALPSLQVRATEYTVGATGPASMPAALPPTSGYTYAVELSVDAAMAANARQVNFTQSVPFYVENFLGFPVGNNVPAGYYDKLDGRWKPTDDGRVIKVLSVTGGMANLAVDTTGVQADSARLAVFGIDNAERQQLASLYAAGQTLWRLPVTHFTIFDLNWAIGLAVDAVAPPLKELFAALDKPCNDPTGSVIECENQVLGEDIGIKGTGMSLVYRSRRTPGWTAGRSLRIPLSGASLPASLKRILLEVEVAGQVVSDTFAKAPNLIHTFTWDGRDPYGRILRGPQPVRVRVGYVYDAVFQGAAQSIRSFLLSSGSQLGSIPSRLEYVAWAEQRTVLGNWDASAAGLGGWNLDVQHAYAPATQTLYQGDGSQRVVQTLAISTIAGRPLEAGYSGDNGPATSALLSGPQMIATGPDGSIYITERGNYSVRKVAPNGIITTFAGGRPGTPGPAGDGGPATQAALGSPIGIAVAPDGSVYIADNYLSRIRRVRTDGIIENFAGTGVFSSTGDGGPALSATIAGPQGLAIGPDGSVYVAEGYRVRRITPDGYISTVAGTGNCNGGGLPFGNPATQVQLCNPGSVAVAPDGVLYITQCCDVYSVVLRVSTDGILTRFAGGKNGYGFAGDGGLATEAKVWNVGQVAVGIDGSIYFTDWAINRVRRVTPDGIITTVAGADLPNVTSGPRGDGGLATQAYLVDPRGLAVGPDGSLYILGYSDRTARKVAPALPALGPGSFSIASEDGADVYDFDASGRHLRTKNALTGATLLSFGYDAGGRLLSVTDADNNILNVERDANGQPTAIVAPFGQRTRLTLDANDRLASVANDANETVRLYHSSTGLLDSLADPRNKVHRFSYDSLGRLAADADPAGGSKSLTRTESDSGWTVQIATALGRTTRYRVDETSLGGVRRVTTDPAGFQATSTVGPDGKNTVSNPDGSTTTITPGADPRFGAQAPFFAALSLNTPGGLTATTSVRRRATLSNPSDPLSLTSRIDSLSLNGQWTVNTYTQSTKQTVETSPEGRQLFGRVDAQGRIVQTRTGGLDSVSYRYDSRGRMDQVKSGGRTWSYGYDGKGRLLSTLDPIGRRDSLFYDNADRLTRHVFPNGREVRFAYDSSGNLAAVTPPGRTAHNFDYTSVDLTSGYTPPNVGLTTPATTYSYNVDRQLTAITRPDSVTISFGYEATTGRPSTVTFDRGQLTYGYSPTTGQLTSVTAPGGSTLGYTYDGMLPTSVTWGGAVQGSIGAGYNNDFRVTSQTVNGANSLSFGYDRDGLLTVAGALGIKRHAQHGLVERDSLGSVKSAWSYSSRGALASYTATSGATTLFQTAYTRDSLDRITGITETIGGSTATSAFTYDSAGRLFEVRRNGSLTATYEYDPNGNRSQLTTPGGVITPAYDAQDRLTQYVTTTYTYGSNGELKTKTEPGVGTTTYTYDALGNLTAVTLPDGTAIAYLIDGQNRRIGKTVNGIRVQGFLYQSQLAPVAELDGSNQVVSRFVYGTRANVPDYLVKGGVTYRLISDHLGSVRLVLNVSTGVVTQRLDYDEYGRVTQNTNPGFQPFGFAGGLMDDHSGLVRFGARDYDPTTGRWTAKDPIGFAGGDGNLYAYVANDPINASDPTGLKDFTQCEAAKFLRSLVDAMQHDPGRFFPQWPLEFDPKANDPGSGGPKERNVSTLQDRYNVDGQWLRSDQFGNFAAGYAGQYVFGSAGLALVHGGGIWAAQDPHSGEHWSDLDSWPMIEAGAWYGARDRGDYLPGTAGAYGFTYNDPQSRGPLTNPCECR